MHHPRLPVADDLSQRFDGREAHLIIGEGIDVAARMDEGI